MKLVKKTVILCLSVVLTAAWTVRYYTLNDGFSVKYNVERLYYDMGDIVPYEEDQPAYVYYCDGYSIQVNGMQFHDADDFLTENDIRGVKGYLSRSDKLVELDVTIYNKDNTNEEDGIRFNATHMLGVDWTAHYSPSIVAYENPIFENDASKAGALRAKPDSSYDVKLFYELRKSEFPEKRWADIENEKMWLEITIMERCKIIRLFE